MSNALALEVRALKKRFGDLEAVAGIDLKIEPGQCLGLLGPNGAGKTTTVEMIVGLQAPDSGEILVFGRRFKDAAQEIRADLGVQLQESKLPDKLKVFESLELFRSFQPRGEEPGAILELIGLSEKRAARVSQLSGGQRQRLALGCALIGSPKLLVLDEPTTGLDPQARRLVWSVVESFKARGGSVLLTTHYMDEAERLSDDLAIMDRGQVIARGAPAQVIASLEADSIVTFAFTEEGSEGFQSDLQALSVLNSVEWREGRFTATMADLKTGLEALLGFAAARDLKVLDLATHRPTLEDVFVHLTGRQLRDE